MNPIDGYRYIDICLESNSIEVPKGHIDRIDSDNSYKSTRWQPLSVPNIDSVMGQISVHVSPELNVFPCKVTFPSII